MTIVCLGLFVRHCMRAENPFIDPKLFAIRPFIGAVLVMAPYSIAFGAMLLSLALWMQSAWGWTALQAGLTIAPGPFLVPVTSLLLAGRLITRFGPAVVVTAGIFCFAAGLLTWATLIGPVPNAGVAVSGMVLTGCGVGLTFPTLMGVAMGSLPPIRVRDRFRRDQHDPASVTRHRRRAVRGHRRRRVQPGRTDSRVPHGVVDHGRDHAGRSRADLCFHLSAAGLRRRRNSKITPP